MKTKTNLLENDRILKIAILVALFSFGVLEAVIGKDKRIEIRGRILLDDTSLADAMLVVEVNDLECVPFDLHDDGRFVLRVPVGSKVQLRFEKPGFLTKEIFIDTKNAVKTKRAEKLNKLVRFDVQMSAAFADPNVGYAGPVGTISFLKGSGLMKVRYDRTLVTRNAQLVEAKKE